MQGNQLWRKAEGGSREYAAGDSPDRLPNVALTRASRAGASESNEGRESRVEGDGLREGLCRDLSFSEQDRAQNIRRAGAFALIAARSGITSICALISPLRRERDAVRVMAESRGIRFLEVHVSTPLEVCESRDPKGLYQKARAGLIPQFTGIDSPYEPPLNPEISIPTEQFTFKDAVERIYQVVKNS